MKKIFMLYEITFHSVGHGHKPTRNIVAPDVETAIKKARKMVGEEWGAVPVGWVNTLNHVDGVADYKEDK